MLFIAHCVSGWTLHISFCPHSACLSWRIRKRNEERTIRGDRDIRPLKDGIGVWSLDGAFWGYTDTGGL